MRALVASVLVGLLAPLGGCDGGTSRGDFQHLVDRVERLEKAGATTAHETAPSTTNAIDRELRALERRIAAVEQRLTALAEGGLGTASDPRAAADDVLISARRERRARLRELTLEYRGRVATIRKEQTDPAARQAALREALEWFRQERRAVLQGDPGVVPAN